MSLAALQRDFRATLTDAGTMAAWIDNAPGIGVYHNAYRVQFVDCLRETFGKLHLWLGDDAFAAAALAHIEANPPHGWTLGVYGEGFDRTVRTRFPDDPEVAELATLEWALSRAFEGANAIPVASDALATIDWEAASLALVPTLALHPATTNAGAIWSALAAETDPPGATMLPEPAAMLVWRQGFTPCFRTIETSEAHAIAMIRDGASFGVLCATMIDRCGADAGVTQAGAMLGQWLHDGLIIGTTPTALSA